MNFSFALVSAWHMCAPDLTLLSATSFLNRRWPLTFNGWYKLSDHMASTPVLIITDTVSGKKNVMILRSIAVTSRTPEHVHYQLYPGFPLHKRQRKTFSKRHI